MKVISFQQPVPVTIPQLNEKTNDIGRYQSDFGLDNAVLSNAVSSNGVISLDNVPINILQEAYSSFDIITTTYGIGQRFYPAFLSGITQIISVDLNINTLSTDGTLKVSIYDATTSIELGYISKTYSQLTAGWNTFTFSAPIAIDSTHEIQLRTIMTSGSVSFKLSTNSSNLQNNTNYITTNNAYTAIGDYTTLELAFRLNVLKKQLSGIIEKTVTPSDLKRWGNLKWTQNALNSTSVKCDVLDGNTKYGDDLIPAMYSYNSSGYSVSSSGENSGFYTWYAFDKSTVKPWVSAYGSVSTWLSFTFPIVTTINKYSIRPSLSTAAMPKSWVLEGSNDNSNWIALDTKTDITLIDNTTNSFGLSAYYSYRYYRIRITKDSSGNIGTSITVAINEFTLGCDTLIIKSSIQSMQDLSDIDIIQYPSLKLRWTLNRNSVSDTSPTVSSVSVTWEGKIVTGISLNYGSFIETSYVSANSTYTKSVPLGTSDYKLAVVRFALNANTLTGGDYRGALVIVRNTIQSGSCIAVGSGPAAASLGPASGGMRSVQPYLSYPLTALDSNLGVSGQTNIGLEHCYINGSNLEFKWKNGSGSSLSLNVAVQWEVLK